jgi:hypothetical protein
MVWPVLVRIPDTIVRHIAEWPLKRVEAGGIVSLVGVGVLALSLCALVFAFMANPRIHWQAIIGLVAGGTALILLFVTLTLSSLHGYLWLLGS